MAIGSLGEIIRQMGVSGVGSPMGQAVGGGPLADPFSPQAIYGGLPYAQPTPGTDQLMAAMGQRGPYAGARGFLRGTGQPQALPRAGLLSELRGGAQGGVGMAAPSSLPMGAGVNPQTMPYSPLASADPGGRAIPMGPAQIPNQGYNGAPVAPRPTSIPRGVNASIPQSMYASSTADDLAASIRATPAGMPRPSGAPSGSSLTAPSATGGSTAGASGSGGLRGMVSRLRSGGGGTAATEAGASTGLRGAARGLWSGGGVKGAVGRGALGMGLGFGLNAGAEAVGTDNAAGQFLQGGSIGAPIGMIAGPQGAAVVGLGTAIANTATGGGLQELLHPTPTAMDTFMEGQAQPGAGDPLAIGNPDLSPLAQVMVSLNDTNDNTFEMLGIEAADADRIKEQFETEVGDSDDQEVRLAALQKAAEEALSISPLAGGASAEPTEMSAADLASMQVMATQLFSPIAADQAALGDMQASSLEAILPNLPQAYQDPVRQMAENSRGSAQSVSNAYIQQASAIPQIAVLDRQQGAIDQTAQQLTAQALGGVMGTGGGSGDLASIISAAAGPQAQGAGGSSDIVNALAGGQLPQG